MCPNHSTESLIFILPGIMTSLALHFHIEHLVEHVDTDELNKAIMGIITKMLLGRQ